MAQTAVEAEAVTSCTIPSAPPQRLPYKAVSAEYNLTSLSTFRACLFTMAVATLVWMSIVYILAR